MDTGRGKRNLNTADSGNQSFGGSRNIKEEVKINSGSRVRMKAGDDLGEPSLSPTQRGVSKASKISSKDPK